MHRLFWKFFLSFWTALILFSALVMLSASHYVDEMRERGSSINPFARLEQYTDQAQQAVDKRGLVGLTAWARNTDRCEAIPILVLNNRGRDILGRHVPDRVVEHILRRNRFPRPVGEIPRFSPRNRVHLANGTEYRLLPDFEGVTLGRILRRPRVIELPLLIAALVSGSVCFVLARYLVRPVERLRQATEAYAAGESYFPAALRDRQYYFPVDRGLEQKIREKLKYLRERDKTSTIRRYD